MKKISIVLILLLMGIIGVGCGKNPQIDKMRKQVMPGNSATKENGTAPKVRLVKKLQHDLFGQGKMQTIGLYVYEYTSASPISWTITVDGKKMIDLARDDYDMADLKFEDIDGDKLSWSFRSSCMGVQSLEPLQSI